MINRIEQNKEIKSEIVSEQGRLLLMLAKVRKLALSRL